MHQIDEHALLSQIFAHLADAVYLIDPDTSNIVWCNPAAHNDLGYSQQEVLNHSVLSLQQDVAGAPQWAEIREVDRKSTRLNSSHVFLSKISRMPSSA